MKMVSLYLANKQVNKYRGRFLARLITIHGPNIGHYLSMQAIRMYYVLQEYQRDLRMGKGLIGYCDSEIRDRIRELNDIIREIEWYQKIVKSKS